MELLLSYQCTILLLFATIFLVSLIAKSKPQIKNLPPGPSPLPIIGNLMKLLPHTSKPHKYFAELAKTHGALMRLQLGSINAVVVSNSDLAKQILLKNNVSSTPYDLDAVRAHEHHIFSISPLPASSPKWKVLRKIYSTQLLSDNMLQAMQRHRHQTLKKMLRYIRDCARANICIDVGQVLYETSFNMMCSTIFSLDLGSDKRMKEILDLMNSIIKEIGRPNIVDCFPFLKVLDPLRIRHRLTGYCVKLFKLFDEILEERFKSKKDPGNFPGLHCDLLDVIIEVMEEQKDHLQGEDIHHMLLDLLGAGMDATSKTMEWAMTELLQNPKTLHKLQQEIDGLAGTEDLTMFESGISQLPYMHAIVTETLRLHPAVPLLLPRKLEQDLNIHGFILPKNTMIIANAWAMGRDPLAWLDPDSFNPDRFLGSDLDVKSQVIKMFTFGAGKKICPGIPFALRMTYLVLGCFISSFEWKLEDFGDQQQDLDMDDTYGITIKKANSLRAFPFERY